MTLFNFQGFVYKIKNGGDCIYYYRLKCYKVVCSTNSCGIAEVCT